MSVRLFFISIFPKKIVRLFIKYDYAFLVHPRDMKDVDKYVPFARFIPQKVKEFISCHLWPVIVSEITGLKDITGKSLIGCIIACPVVTSLLMKDKERATNKIIEAAKLAELLNIKIIGLGALTSSFTNGGLKILEKLKKIKITSGHGFTSYIVAQHVLGAIKKMEINTSQSVIAVVGAAGSIGSNSIKLLVDNKFAEIILIDVERKKKTLDELKIELSLINSKNEIIISSEICDLKRADIIITATNTPEALIYSENLKPGVIIVDDAQPTDIDDEVYKSRNDVLLLEGGVVNTPNINCHFDFGLKEKGDIFSCLGEVMVLAYLGYYSNYNIGKLQIEKIKMIEETSKKLHFTPGKFQNYYKLYSDEDINSIKKIIIERNKYE